jgi:renalase
VENRVVLDVLIIGAGLAGLTAARELTRAGYAVRILEKSAGVSGRAATKRLESGAIADFGAPFFTVRNDAFRAFVQTLEHNKIVHVWQNGMKTWRSGNLEGSPDGYPRYVATQGISAIGKALRNGESHQAPLDIVQNAMVSAIWSNHLGYRAVLENGDIHTARAVLVNTPAPQAMTLTKSVIEPKTNLALEQVEFAPCWALIVSLKNAPNVDWNVLKLEHPVLSLISLEHSKRGGAPILLLHANAEWSTQNLERSPQSVADLMIQAAQEVLGEVLEPNQTKPHRWRYAQATKPHLGAYVAQDNLVFCGDWCAPAGSARIETAFESGLASAEYLIKQLGQPLELLSFGINLITLV